MLFIDFSMGLGFSQHCKRGCQKSYKKPNFFQPEKLGAPKVHNKYNVREKS